MATAVGLSMGNQVYHQPRPLPLPKPLGQKLDYGSAPQCDMWQVRVYITSIHPEYWLASGQACNTIIM